MPRRGAGQGSRKRAARANRQARRQHQEDAGKTARLLRTGATAFGGDALHWPSDERQAATFFFAADGRCELGCCDALSYKLTEADWAFARNFVEDRMPGTLSEMALSRIKWARSCVFCTCDLRTREDQALARTDLPANRWAAAFGSAVEYRPDGFRVCWVCAGDFRATGSDPMTAPLPEGVDVRQKPDADAPISVRTWTAGRTAGLAVGQ